MTKPRTDPTRGNRQKDSEKKHRKHVLSPCDRPPIVPVNLHGDFDRNGQTRYHKLRLKGRWDEVHEDTSGFRLQVRHYQVALEYSAQDTPGTWYEAERFFVPPKDDNEPNDTAHFVVKGSIVANLAYRWRVRAIGYKGCKSDWTLWYEMGDAGGDNPPAPLNVTIHDRSVDRVVVDWDPSPDSVDPDILDEKVAHYACEISGHQDFSPVYKRDIFVHGTQRTFKIGDAHLGEQFFARAWAVGTSRDKSIKIPATLDGNNDPFAQADGVTVDIPSQAKFPPGVIHHWPGPVAKIPAGWLLCDGSSYSTTVYAELFAAIGYTYGGGGGQFNVPDGKGRHIKGVNPSRGEVEGQADDGRGVADFDFNRSDDHPSHPRHKHMHHHRNRRRDHDDHPNASSDGSGGHDHTVGPFNTPIGGPSGLINNVPSGGVRDVAGPNHNHDISGSTGQGGSGHTHPGIGGTKIQGTKSKQRYGVGGTNPVTGLPASHDDHTDAGVSSDGPPDVYADSITGGSRGVDGGQWDGGETTAGGTFATVDTDIPQQYTGRGHRGHPKHRMHFIIKT